jgi:hypothetical protein
MAFNRGTQGFKKMRVVRVRLRQGLYFFKVVIRVGLRLIIVSSLMYVRVCGLQIISKRKERMQFEFEHY